jgi:hypothetical protein
MSLPVWKQQKGFDSAFISLIEAQGEPPGSIGSASFKKIIFLAQWLLGM